MTNMALPSRKKVKKKAGRKAVWDEAVVDDLIDIITEDERLKSKLLFTNVKNSKNSQYYLVVEELKKRCEERGCEYNYTIVQTRDKFKRCVNLCKDATLKYKTGTGIVRREEEKELGNWFKVLQPIVATMDSVQPEQSIEPSSVLRTKVDAISQVSLNHTAEHNPEPLGLGEGSSTNGNGGRKRSFVPTIDSSRKRKKLKRSWWLMTPPPNSLK